MAIGLDKKTKAKVQVENNQKIKKRAERITKEKKKLNQNRDAARKAKLHH